ncbi:uncharacterized protein MONOS_11247 [Monocercomonoides exilis]|uniref:uncharacterized protein n=1 Tax=Monocercomonoides exilis TaxID=2049356 RepID=UPI0035594501|nr:hypothetical protein MONOS_11247 [Monocercomonoides exilis]|eukprot:MONOS_11247.1-p1 / transcript=MONOS_11247.1 / gene=MONOS_11247 / organism=Monocercomonoides_exilis_PA203 / gene_product=unspecified product / transcript_product=unspecified product / location=Mono_scaffold00554:6585-7013(+) / protein_length=143 / sequence_SO=supercontig / SO=protein_coding / is_pseudo=false
MMWLFGEFGREEFNEDKLSFFLFFSIVLERVAEKKIMTFLGEFEKIQSEKKEADASMFLRFLLNYFRAEAMKRKEEMKALYDAICCSDPSVSSSASSSSLGVVCRGITHSELESLLYVSNLSMQLVLSLQVYLDVFRISGCC